MIDIMTARGVVSLFKSVEHAQAEVDAARTAGHDTILLTVPDGIGFISVERVAMALTIYNLAN